MTGAASFLITGVNGLLGNRLCAQLVADGHPVLGVSRGPARLSQSAPYASLELTDASAVEALVSQHRPTVIIHPAAMTDLDRCEKDPAAAWASNVTATANLARAATAVGAHLVHVSTDYIFDGAAGPYPEDASPHPIGVYAVTKHASEYAASVLAPGCTIARTAVVYGHIRGAKTNFGLWLYDTLSRGEQVRLFLDQFVTPSLADNVAQQLIELGTRRLSGVFNVCGADFVSRVEFGQVFCQVFGFDPGLLQPIRLADSGLVAHRPPRAGLTSDKARSVLHTPPLRLTESLQRFRELLLATRTSTP